MSSNVRDQPYYGTETSILRNIHNALLKDLRKMQTQENHLRIAISRRRRGYPNDTFDRRPKK